MQEDHERAVSESNAAGISASRSHRKGHLDQRLIDAREELLELEQFLPLAERCEELKAPSRRSRTPIDGGRENVEGIPPRVEGFASGGGIAGITHANAD